MRKFFSTLLYIALSVLSLALLSGVTFLLALLLKHASLLTLALLAFSLALFTAFRIVDSDSL